MSIHRLKPRLIPYWRIVVTAAYEDTANIGRLSSSIILSVIRVALIAAIYSVAYRSVDDPSLSYTSAVWSIAIYFAFILNLGLRNIFKVVDEEVRTGIVEVGLIKPVEWRLTKFCELVGKNSTEFLLQLLILPIALFIFVGGPNVSHMTFPVMGLFAVLVLLAVVTAVTMFMTIGLSSFWLNDAHSVFRIIDKITLIFGGGFVPIALLPETVQLIVRYSPFGVYAAPTQIFNPNIGSVLPLTLLSAVLWSALLIVLCEWIWRKAKQRIEINGG